MNESNLVGGRLHMYETNGYQNFMIESIAKTFAEYYLRFSESVNKKRWMAFRPSVLTLSFQGGCHALWCYWGLCQGTLCIQL